MKTLKKIKNTKYCYCFACHPKAVCINCGAVAAFDGFGGIRPFSQQELNNILSDKNFMDYLKRIVGAVYFFHGHKEWRQN